MPPENPGNSLQSPVISTEVIHEKWKTLENYTYLYAGLIIIEIKVISLIITKITFAVPVPYFKFPWKMKKKLFNVLEFPLTNPFNN
jgi:hypothetical protein